jgi:hypothetical protein
VKRYVLLLTLLAACVLQVASQTVARPDFNGTWILQSDASSEIYTFQHDDKQLHIIERIDDSIGKRVVVADAAINGLPHHQSVEGDHFILTAQWFGDSLVWETRRERSIGIFDNRRIMKLAGHDEIRALRTRFLPGPEQSWDEVWLRQKEK